MHPSRRHFLRKAAIIMLLFPWARSWACGKAKDPKVLKKLLDPKSKTAVRLAYVQKAEDGKGHPKWKANADCGNCKFYRPYKKEKDYGKCTMAANRYVPSCGWCKSYLVKKS